MNVYIPPIIEKVYNVQGSTAAPGSGEYHRYRAMRRRERTLAAAMEKEYKERKAQKDFEEGKETKQQRIEHERMKKKNKRIKKEEKNKMKKTVLKSIGVNGVHIFKKDVPLIEQIKSEIGETEFKKLCYREHEQDNDLDFNEGDNYNKIKLVPIKRIANPNLISTDQKEKEKINTNFEDEEENIKPDENLLNLFPKTEKAGFEFENFEDYEEHLEILDIIEKNEKGNKQGSDKNKPQEEIKYVEETENIIIHDEDY